MKYLEITRQYKVLITVFALIGGLLASLGVTAQSNDENRASVEVSISPERVSPGAEVVLNLKLKLAEGAHANSDQVADPNLIPTVFLPKPQTGLSWGQPQYPPPTQVTEWYSTDPLSVFEDGTVITVPLTVEKTIIPGQVTVEGTLRIQVCDSEKCYPMRRVPVKVSLLVGKEDSANPNNSAGTATLETNPGNSTTKPNSSAGKQVASGSGIDFDFVDFTGKPRKLSEFRGKFVLLDFWATWCKPCLADIPKLKELYEKYQAQGFEIIGMDAETIGDEEGETDLEFAKETAERAKNIVETRGVTWTQATNDTAVPVGKKLFNVKALPTKILLDRDGKVIATIGEKDDLKAIVQKLLSPK